MPLSTCVPREGERGIEREREGETETEPERDSERERERVRDRETKTETETEKNRETHDTMFYTFFLLSIVIATIMVII